MTKHALTKMAESKGWRAKQVAERWGYGANYFSRMAKEPRQVHVDALNGLPGSTDLPKPFKEVIVRLDTGKIALAQYYKDDNIWVLIDPLVKGRVVEWWPIPLAGTGRIT